MNEAILGPDEATRGNNESLFQDPLSALKGTMRSVEGSLRFFSEANEVTCGQNMSLEG